VQYISTETKDFDGSIYGSYRKTIHQADGKVQDVIDYVNSLLNKEPTMIQLEQKYKEYIELLEETHNLVLTGAPGTGKTYMARAIAEEMGAVTKFVQFHPSYDYTDFVEGLRPIDKGDDQMGFKRRDGVFKAFCKQALEALIDETKEETEISNEAALQLFKDDLRKQGEIEIPSYLGPNSVPRTVLLNENNTVSVRASNKHPSSDERILNYMRTRNGADFGGDTYIISIGEHILQKYKHKSLGTTDKQRPFVFIIDEINRGEASKIFGELFFAIDPGYRGKTDFLVQTQYQNLVPNDDVFAEGFYVPENVYILATMNDIDRSVESMDFAMRRRFTWHEIAPNDTESMLDELKCADEAKAAMHRLNAAIAETDGLGAAYMIGPAYFLKLKNNGGDFDKLWKMNIEPLLKEYLRGFRKTKEILDTFSKAYFNENNEATTGHPALEE
jgi:5-methylcytosine-specific restriction endonuclease McrBC GTP-binding regulatory subunit McrB